jgi:hypothetical protein
MGKRITLSRPRIESFAEGSADRTAFFMPVLLVVGPDFFPDDLCITVEDDDVVTTVVVETVSAGGVATCVTLDEAVAVSAADCAGRLQPPAKTTAEKAPANDSFVIARLLV